MPLRIVSKVTDLVRPTQPVPANLRPIFFNLFMDMVWYGVLSGTTLAFLSVYAARLGATNDQIGFLSAAPAVVNLIFAIPSGLWMKNWRLGRVNFWGAFGSRIFYLSFVFFPLFLGNQAEVWAIILATLVMTIPTTFLNVGFSAMMIEEVPGEWRAFVMGLRNGLLSIISLVVTLGSGKLLESIAFPLGYQIVFGIGFFGAAMSTFHLWLLRSTGTEPVEKRQWTVKEVLLSMIPRIDLKTANPKYLRVLALLFCFHVAQWLVIPVIPLYSVNILKLDDFQISIGNSAFNLVVFIGSFFLGRVTSRFGNQKVAGASMMGLGTFPLLMSLSHGFPMYVVANLVGGTFWAILSGALFNYLADNVPEQDRSTSVSWYILVSNASILIGSLAGPKIAGGIGFSEALFIFAIMRMLAGLAVLRWG